ncbi:MAG: zinc-dependent peptidase [Ilumatobacteraceae bacterium]|nr:zinc-dependent peptidase [Ilumatobacteraceae bacterium]
MQWRRSSIDSTPDESAIEAIVTANVGIAARFGPELRQRLFAHVDELLRTKRWEAVAGSELTDEILVTLAANAAIPLLSFDLWPYRQVKSIIVRPTVSISGGLRAGPVAGTYTDQPIGIIGEASPHSGPVSLSWDAALADSRRPAYGSNVVIHEFAHKIDMNDGYADGVPPLRGTALTHWQQVLRDEFHRTEGRDSDAVLRPYAWASPAEFFAVATETFFCVPTQLTAAKPVLYAALSDLYHQSPAVDCLPLDSAS